MPKTRDGKLLMLTATISLSFISGLFLVTSVLGCGDPGDPAVCNAADSIQAAGLVLMLTPFVIGAVLAILFVKRKLFK